MPDPELVINPEPNLPDIPDTGCEAAPSCLACPCPNAVTTIYTSGASTAVISK